MKFGIRKRSYKKSFSAMTTGRLKRAAKRQVIPFYGKKDTGWIKNPKKAAYNAAYRHTTIKSPLPYFNSPLNTKPNKRSSTVPQHTPTINISGGLPETIATSSKALAVSSTNFEQLKQDLTRIYEHRAELRRQLTKAQSGYYLTFIFTPKEKRQAKKEDIERLKTAIDHAYLDLTFRKGMKDAGSWDECSHYFQELMQASAIVWDLTSRQDTDKYRQRTVADESVDRKPITVREHKTLEFIKADVDNLYFPNVNGADLYVYPTFIVLFKNYKEFGIHDLQQVDVTVTAQSFHEDGKVPADATVVGQTYKYTNKNGTPDKRYQNNYAIPVAKYGNLSFRSEAGINDRYMFSNFDKFVDFGKTFVRYARANLKMSVHQ